MRATGEPDQVEGVRPSNRLRARVRGVSRSLACAVVLDRAGHDQLSAGTPSWWKRRVLLSCTANRVTFAKSNRRASAPNRLSRAKLRGLMRALTTQTGTPRSPRRREEVRPHLTFGEHHDRGIHGIERGLTDQEKSKGQAITARSANRFRASARPVSVVEEMTTSQSGCRLRNAGTSVPTG